jgi:hypothetical protein
VKPFSNAEVARMVGVHPITLERWLASGDLPWPKMVVSGGRVVRLWNEVDVQRAREYKTRTAKKRTAEKSARLLRRPRRQPEPELV